MFVSYGELSERIDGNMENDQGEQMDIQEKQDKGQSEASERWNGPQIVI